MKPIKFLSELALSVKDQKKRLQQFQGAWRVDGVGEVDSFLGKIPHAKFCLSRLKEGKTHEPFSNSSLENEHKDIRAPLNWISDLIVGSVWKDGKRISRPTLMGDQYTIDTSSIRLVRANEKISLHGKRSKYLGRALPEKAIKFGQNSQYLDESLYAIVPVLGNERTEYLITPCSELYSFYIGVGSRFANLAVTGDLEKYVEWKGDRLRLKERLARDEKFVAYRSYFSSQGQEWFYSAKKYLNSIVLQNTTRPFSRQLFRMIKAGFPFSDITTLTVAGKRFPYDCEGESQIWAIFAGNILRCDYPAEFDPLFESDTFPGDGDGEPGYGDGEGSGLDYEDEEFGEDEEETDGPSGGGRVGVLTPANRFGAMDGMKFPHVHPDQSTDPIYPTNEKEEGFSSEDADFDEPLGEGKGVDQYITHENASRDLAAFIEMIKSFRNLVEDRGWEVQTRCLNSIIAINGEAATTFLLSDNKRRTWHKIKIDVNEYRLRQIVWVEVKITDDQFFYLMEMELKESESGRSTLHVFAKDLAHMTDYEFKTFLSLTSFINGWPQKKHHPKWSDNDKRKKKADSHFSKFYHIGITHPTDIFKKKEIGAEEYLKWAESVLANVEKYII